MFLNNEISSFEEYFWTYNQSCKSIVEYRQKLESDWDDNASKELNAKFFNPHAEDSENSLSFFQEQIKCLNEMNTHLTTIESLLAKIKAISSEIETLAAYSESDIKKSYYSLNESIENKIEAKQLLEKVNSDLKKINIFSVTDIKSHSEKNEKISLQIKSKIDKKSLIKILKIGKSAAISIMFPQFAPYVVAKALIDLSMDATIGENERDNSTLIIKSLLKGGIQIEDMMEIGIDEINIDKKKHNSM